MELTVSLAQMDIALGDPASNLAKVTDWVAEAAQRGSDMLVLPELWSTGYDLTRAPELASTTTDGLMAKLAELAAQHNIWLMGSTLISDDQPQPANRATLIDPHGEVIAYYDKIHLFGLMDEDQYLAAGQKLALTETPWGKAGLAICYDLRFPEIFRSYALAGASMMLLPSEWPYPRLAHWRTLLQARAIENQFFILACNRVGADAKNTFCGHSIVLDPWGNAIIEANDQETLMTTSIDLAAVPQIRKRIPVFNDRRPELYQLEEI